MSEVTTNEYNEDGKLIRKIRSFVRREGRLTKGQESAMNECWPTMGIDFKAELLDWKEVFGNDNPVVLEIGFGMGASLVEMAKNAPEKNFIGIEVHSPGVGACLADAREAGITNCRVMCHDAVEVFEHMIPKWQLIDTAIVLPRPLAEASPQASYCSIRFCGMVREKLIPNEGIFHMATDWENYAEHMIEVMNQAPGFENIAKDGDFVPRPDDRPLTKFEARGHRLGHGVWDIKYKRIA
ncbi:LOW QUALITY PROTEIN: tRNA (guanine46-N7-)-methyltransferase [Vibrio sp. JCM 18904]|nr:LOW QUALITY PROTEIN: tRNA (guanine46-N7-)-methyltransferase [Vibrio sp. JCM 18904]